MDREMQHRVLKYLREHYPEECEPAETLIAANSDMKTVSYLLEHGLIHAKTISSWQGEHIGSIRLTAKGWDFLENDGGLTAILGVVTIKLHDDTIRQLLIDRVQSSDEPETVKSKIVEAIKSAPADVIKSLTQNALEAGIKNIPNAVQLFQNWLPNG